MKCCVCGGQDAERIVSYARMAAMQSQIYKEVSGAGDCPTGALNIEVCRVCGAVSNDSFDPELVQYSEESDNSQDASPAFIDHKKDMISYFLRFAKQPEWIMEIGCGKGRFLSAVAEQTTAFCYGYDPAYEGALSTLDGRLSFQKKYYDGTDEKKYDIVILRHVIEHIQNPVRMFRSISEALSDDGVLYLETPSLEWILKNNVIFDFTYEHCSYFTIDTISHLLKLGNLELIDSQYTFSAQYLSLIARKKVFSDDAVADIPERVIRPLMEALHCFETGKNKLRKEIRAFLKQAQEKGGICFWGAAGKGVACCNIFDPERELVDCVVDINPNKQGGYIPMTAHPIISPEQLPAYGIKLILVTNANYFDEVKALAEEICGGIRVYDFEKMMKEVIV